MKLRLWLVRETDHAWRYCKLPESRGPGPDEQSNPNYVWIPRSVCEGTLKFPPREAELAINPKERSLHIVTVQDWFAERENL